MMDHSLGAWLQRHGKRNLFEALSEDECRQMLQQLEDRLEQEEQLAAEVHELADHAHQSTCLTPPYGVVAIDAPTQEAARSEPPPPAPSKGWAQRQVLVMACALFALCGWSAGLYHWGYQRGNQQAQEQLARVQAPQKLAKVPPHATRQGVTPRIQASQPVAASAPPFRLVAPLRLPVVPSLEAPRPNEALRSPFLGQSRQQLSLQWAMQEERPHTIALSGRLGFAATSGQRTWGTPAPYLLPPKQLPASHNFDLPTVSLMSATQ